MTPLVFENSTSHYAFEFRLFYYLRFTVIIFKTSVTCLLEKGYKPVHTVHIATLSFVRGSMSGLNVCINFLKL